MCLSTRWHCTRHCNAQTRDKILGNSSVTHLSLHNLLWVDVQGVQGMHAVQYALPAYGFMPRPAPDGMPAAMAAAGYPGVQYPPGVYPMQLAMPQHMQQVRLLWHQADWPLAHHTSWLWNPWHWAMPPGRLQ